jgi:hypothetical protein
LEAIPINNRPITFSVWHGLFLVEVIAVVIGIAMTITPSKTGSKYGVAGHFFDEPTIIQEFLVNFVSVNVVMVVLAVAFALWWWISGSRRSST